MFSQMGAPGDGEEVRGCVDERPDHKRNSTATDQPQRTPTRRPWADPAHRRRSKTPGQPAHPQPPQPHPSPAMAHLETTPPSPCPLVPPTNPPHQTMTRSRSTTAVLGFLAAPRTDQGDIP